jgi:methionyl-tRNA formyltransferase
MTKYIVANTKPWNREAFDAWPQKPPGNWLLVETPEQLSEALKQGSPARYIFFPHWSWKVSEDLLNQTECVCFHMTDLPYGQGGSPLQNLIVRGHAETMLSALRMTNELDAGPIYAKTPLDLSGTAQEIFERASSVIFNMIREIVQNEPKPNSQSGTVTKFSRLTPAQSQLPQQVELRSLYDHIRMLDAETYPTAFLEYGDFRIEFSDAIIDGDTLSAKVVIQNK